MEVVKTKKSPFARGNFGLILNAYSDHVSTHAWQPGFRLSGEFQVKA